MLQTGSQTMAFRLAAYFGRRGLAGLGPRLRCVPAAFRGEAEELGPRSDRAGPCLVLLRGVRASPAEFQAFLRRSFIGLYVHRLYWVDLAVAVAGGGPDQDLAAVLHPRPGDGDSEVRKALEKAVVGAWEGRWGRPGGAVRLQFFPRRLELPVAEALEDRLGVPCDPKAYCSVVSAVPVDGVHRLGLIAAADLWMRTTDLVGTKRLGKGPAGASPSKARGKLEGALELLDNEEREGGDADADADGGAGRGLRFRTAIDLGAAPGAWTAVLAGRADRVWAVDPTPALDAEVAALPNVEHLAMKAQDAARVLKKSVREGCVDIIVCDINRPAFSCAEIVADLLPILRPGGLLVMTLKLTGLGRSLEGRLSRFEQFLDAAGIEAMEVAWLMANTGHERTLLARKR